MESSQATSLLLSIQDANKSYGGIPVLRHASIDLQAGEVHALMGENGAGKSTLIKLMAGVVTADSIKILVHGQPATINHPQAAFDLGLRFIHQELNIVPQLSVAENIFLGQKYPTYVGLLVNWNRLNKRAKAVLAQLGVTHIDPHIKVARLSPGDQMLVSIARAFVGEVTENTRAIVYVMDEPTAALTGQETAQLFAVIDQLKKRGCAILYVSHRLDEIFKIADRVTVMRDGQIVSISSIQSVTSNDLIHMMTGRELQQVYPARETRISDQIMLDVHGLETASIKNVSFQLAEGEILGIAGLSGSGRTELLRGIMGADYLVSGTIQLDNQPLKRPSPWSSWRSGIAFVPEERRSQGLILSRNVGNNVTLPQLRYLSHFGIFLNHRSEWDTSTSIGESIHLKAKNPAQIVRQLSGGNQQKVVFARALVRPPRILLLDEPTRGVDVGAKADIYGLIRKISASGTGILMVSSDLPELLGMTDRILIMRNGQTAGIVETIGLTEAKLLALCYGEMHDGNH